MVDRMSYVIGSRYKKLESNNKNNNNNIYWRMKFSNCTEIAEIKKED